MANPVVTVEVGSPSAADRFGEVDRLCQAYNYPAEIHQLLSEITTAVTIPGVEAVLLSGSASRGELVFVESADHIKLFSDFEFFVIGDHLDAGAISHSASKLN